MKEKDADNIVLIGKMKDVLAYLKSCEKEYTYVIDLIRDLSTPKTSPYIN